MILIINSTVATILFQIESFGFVYYVLVILFLVTSLLALFSFTPNIATNIYKNKSKINVNDNLLFWKTISKYSINEYKNIIIEDIDKNYVFTKQDDYFIEQIINNSKISSFKYFLFDFEVKIDILALIIVVICVIVA